MIKAKVYGGRSRDHIALLGLSGENVTRLVAGEPILINLADIGLPPQRVAIVYGRTEAAIVAEMKTHLRKITIHTAPTAPETPTK